MTKTEPTEQDSEITQMELSFPVEDWTVPQLKNFLHTLYSNQHILRRMMQSDALYIDRQMMERLDEAQTPADLEARLPTVWRRACSRAVASRTAGSLSRRFDDRDPVRWQVYATLLCAILEHAKLQSACFSGRMQIPRTRSTVATAFSCAWASAAGTQTAAPRAVGPPQRLRPHSGARQACRRTGKSTRSCAGNSGRRRGHERVA